MVYKILYKYIYKENIYVIPTIIDLNYLWSFFLFPSFLPPFFIP